jgi:RNA polymerase sigma-70 factor (ECF subfamily)
VTAAPDADLPVRQALAAGDVEGAATAALRRHGPGVLGYLCALLDEDDAKDAFQLFAEDLWRGLPGFRFEGSLRAWTYRLAWHAAARFSREAWRRRRERLPSSAASRLAASIASASALAPGGRSERLGRLREHLSREEQTLLVLRVDRELEWEEVAAVLAGEGAPATAAALRKRFERLKAKLQSLARDEGLLE